MPRARSSGRRSALVCAAPRGHSAAYLIHSSPMLAALEALFDAEWERAMPIASSVPPKSAPAADPADHALPNAETRALLNLLSSGLSDSAIARTKGGARERRSAACSA